MYRNNGIFWYFSPVISAAFCTQRNSVILSPYPTSGLSNTVKSLLSNTHSVGQEISGIVIVSYKVMVPSTKHMYQH